MPHVTFPALVDAGYWLPENASVTIQYVDPVFHYILYLTTAFFVLIVALMLYFMVRYRKRSDADRTHPIAGSHKIEAIGAIIPSILLATIFWLGFRGYMNLATTPPDAMQIRVTGQKWYWTFEYPQDGIRVSTAPDLVKIRSEQGKQTGLVVPVDTNVELIASSLDVLHSMFIPAFRVKKDAVPNRYTSLWFRATETGVFDYFCTEYCGDDHSRMVTKVIVKSKDDYATWLKETKAESVAPVDGKTVFAKGGCAACHSIAGATGIGPPLNGKYGTDEALEGGGTAKVDDNYIRESLMNPTAKVVRGFAPVMPVFAGQLEDREVDALIDYIKSLK